VIGLTDAKYETLFQVILTLPKILELTEKFAIIAAMRIAPYTKNVIRLAKLKSVLTKSLGSDLV
jgi:hypothetical protein